MKVKWKDRKRRKQWILINNYNQGLKKIKDAQNLNNVAYCFSHFEFCFDEL